MGWGDAQWLLHDLAKRNIFSVAEGLKLPWRIVWEQYQILRESNK